MAELDAKEWCVHLNPVIMETSEKLSILTLLSNKLCIKSHVPLSLIK